MARKMGVRVKAVRAAVAAAKETSATRAHEMAMRVVADTIQVRAQWGRQAPAMCGHVTTTGQAIQDRRSWTAATIRSAPESSKQIVANCRAAGTEDGNSPAAPALRTGLGNPLG